MKQQKKQLFCLILFLLAVTAMQAQGISIDHNHIITRTPLDATSDASTSTGRVLLDIEYYDGLGRPELLVERYVTPGGDDLLHKIEYDACGRISRQHLPVPVGGNHGGYYNNLAAAAANFYQDGRLYSETQYEASPLGRVTAITTPGEYYSFPLYPKFFLYETNAANEVKLFTVDTNKNLQFTGFYGEATLNLAVAVNEDGKSYVEYTDKQGRLIMSNRGYGHDTYYVYDDLGNLCYVLPPLAADGITTPGTVSVDDERLKRYAYVYRYDHRRRCSGKRLPGQDWIYMVYDKADRLVLMQDGKQRQSSQWTVTKYDPLGRVAYTGYIEREVTQAEQELINNTIVTETFTTDWSLDLYNIGYTCKYFIGEVWPLTVYYYDNYDFLELGFGKNDSLRADMTMSPHLPSIRSTKGLLTGMEVYDVDGISRSEAAAYYYNTVGEVVQERHANHLGGYDVYYHVYDFVGNLTYSYQRNTATMYGLDTIQKTCNRNYAFDYDHAGRPTRTRLGLNGKEPVVLSTQSYDELGRLSEETYHNGESHVKYQYDLRGWLEHTEYDDGEGYDEWLFYCDNPAGTTPLHSGQVSYTSRTYAGDTDTEGIGYEYDLQNRLATTVYMQGGMAADTMLTNGEGFSYDKMGNITRLERYSGTTQIDDLTFTYDGNQVVSVQDAAGSQNLYALKEYQDLADEETECTYDANGNLTRDLDRGITNIRYNRLNLPEWVTFTNGDRISMDYDATGRLLEMSCTNLSTKLMPLIVDGERVQANIPVTEGYGTLYGDGIDYEYEYVYDETTGHSRPTITNVRVHHPEGYADVSQRYYAEDHFYYYRYDYLGNVCEVWSPGWEMAPDSFAPPHVAQQTRYYPSGLPKVPLLVEGLQPYKYGGKEYVEGHGWDMYDSGARWYYPAIMRTTSPDPLAERHYDTSPYAWCGNNPMRNIDPTGMDYWSTNDPDEMNRFINAVESGESVFDFYGWSHVSDQEFLNKLEQGELTYNDEKGVYYLTQGEMINGEFTLVSKSIPANLRPSFSGNFGYDGIPIYEPLSGFWQHAAYYVLGWHATYSTPILNYSINPQGRISGVEPLTGTPPLPGMKGGKLVQKMGKAKGNMTGNRNIQQKQFDSVVKKLGLSKQQAQQLHNSIHNQGYGYQEILKEAKYLFNK